jgi:hypothetical protein
MVSTKLLVVVSLPHDDCYSLLLEVAEVDATGFPGFSFIEMYTWSSKGDVGG